LIDYISSITSRTSHSTHTDSTVTSLACTARTDDGIEVYIWYSPDRLMPVVNVT